MTNTQRKIINSTASCRPKDRRPVLIHKEKEVFIPLKREG